MPTMKKMDDRQKEERAAQEAAVNMDRTMVFLKEGDVAFLQAVVEGNDEDDGRLDDYRQYSIPRNGGQGFMTILDEDDLDNSLIPDGVRPQHKFAFWAYVFEIHHAKRAVNKQNETPEYAKEWEEIDVPGTGKMFKETVNDYKIFSFGFGRGDVTWNGLSTVFYEWGEKLNKGTMKITRQGSGLNTTYDFRATIREDEILPEKVEQADDLQRIVAYMTDHFGATARAAQASGGSTAIPAGASATTSEDLPW